MKAVESMFEGAEKEAARGGALKKQETNAAASKAVADAARELQAHLDSLLKSGLVKTGSSEALNKLLEECKQGVQMLSFGGLRRSNSEENLGQNDSESESSDAEGVFASGGLLRKVCSEDNLCAMHRSRFMSVVHFVTRTCLLSLHCAFAYCRSEAYSHSKIAREQKST